MDPGLELAALRRRATRAQKLGLAGWQALYKASAGVIGGDANKIHPGPVLVLPQFSISDGGAPYNQLI